MTITLGRVVETCSSSPSQWDAWTVDGEYLYLRYRWGVGTIERDPGAGLPVARFDTGRGLDGSIEREDFLVAAGLELTQGAKVLS